jgi:hypothetical protein
VKSDTSIYTPAPGSIAATTTRAAEVNSTTGVSAGK